MLNRFIKTALLRYILKLIKILSIIILFDPLSIIIKLNIKVDSFIYNFAINLIKILTYNYFKKFDSVLIQLI